MCCFTVATPFGLVARLFARRVHVSNTNIFARVVEPGRQALAYGMNLTTGSDVAMVLPLPVAAGSGEDAVRFVDLSATPELFVDLASLFIPPQARKKGGFELGLGLRAQRLVVHRVGSFVASYVPSRGDFARLDPRFRLPEVLFEAVPHYADYGFAVFQLVPGKVTVHPMALTFPTRAPDRLFFPTVHVHDGRFRPTARFDHTLYYQVPGEPADQVAWISPRQAYNGVVDPGRAVARRTLRARLPNTDTWIAWR